MRPPAAGPQSGPKLAIETTATVEATRFLGDLVALFLREGVGIEDEVVDAVQFRLAVVEAITNVHRHAYPTERPGPVSLELVRSGDSLVATIRDRGPAFDPRGGKDGIGAAKMPRPEDLAEGGYGLAILARVMDEIRHCHCPEDGNELVLEKRIWT